MYVFLLCFDSCMRTDSVNGVNLIVWLSFHLKHIASRFVPGCLVKNAQTRDKKNMK